MLQAEQSVRDLFCVFWTRGISLGAFALRCEIPVEKLTRELAGLGDWPEWIALDEKTRTKLLRGLTWGIPNAKELGDGYKVLYCATRGPRGSVRWHHWSVPDEQLPSIFSREPREQLIWFSTLDALSVALNPQHVVTMMYGNEDDPGLIEHSAFVPSQSTTGALVPYSEHDNVLEREFREFRLAVRTGGPDGFEDLPFAVDMRAPRAFLLDLQHAFMDHSISSLGEEAVTDGEQWHLWDELGVTPRHGPVTFADRDGSLTHVKLPPHQITVLECPLRLQERATHRDVIDNANSSMSATKYREELIASGLFSADEIARMGDELAAALSELPTPINRRPKKRLSASFSSRLSKIDL